ncbi:NnrU family protein [Nordella sp. HKS 07]|uniref:NnrU family protein n=1 Tax=Nordella sp. HKS 07 TaxID=2712222 RepID=UPI0013E138AD|nr:NnrU family protein [Nordella sp. HKS 07]QIG50622.1 NnrU family protein [Nordella sp. HKS 07]
MSLLIIGIVIFVGAHLVVMLNPRLRDSLSGSLGEGPYKGVFSLVSLLGLALMIYGFYTTRGMLEGDDYLYTPAPWTRHAAMTLVLLGFIFVGASHGKGYLKRWLKQPMSIGIGLWAVAHLLANGDRPGVVMFGAILALAVIDIILSTARGKVPTHEPRLRSDVIAVIVGIVLYAIFLFVIHPYVFNLPIIV